MTLYAPNLGLEDNRHRGRYYGKYSGVVIDDNDPDKVGRLQVSVPAVWAGAEPLWARPCFPAGHFFTPVIGSKVWVEFEAGDPQFPIWVGVWYPTDSVPAEARLAPPTSRVIKTASGHTVEFADKDGEESILIRHKGNAFISIDKKGSVVVGNASGSVVYLNSDQHEASVISEQGHRVVLSGDGMALTHNDGSFVDLRSDKVTVSASAKVQVMANEVAVTGGAVSLGSAPQFGVVIDGPAFEAFLLHVHPSAMGPTGPPAPPAVGKAMASTSIKASP
jgi:uncharacterized protein involved in type VI secretion and phage assembly